MAMKHIVIFPLLLYLACVPFRLHGQIALWEVLDDMAQENTFSDVGVGRGYNKDRQRTRFDQLKQEATDDELLALTDDANAVIRCYAFLALADKHHPEVFAVLLRHLADNEEIAVLSGCLGRTTTVGELFFSIARGRYSEEKHPHRLTPEQQKEVEKILSRFGKEQEH